MKRGTIAVATLVATAALAAAAAYIGWPSNNDLRAVQWLKDHPGGVLTGPTEITYTRRDGLPLIVVTFQQKPEPTPNCPANTLCLYAAPGYGYPRAATDACGYIDLQESGWARRVRSIHNNLPGGTDLAGTVAFYRSDGGPPSDANQHRILTLRPASRTAVTAPPDIDYLYHSC